MWAMVRKTLSCWSIHTSKEKFALPQRNFPVRYVIANG